MNVGLLILDLTKVMCIVKLEVTSQMSAGEQLIHKFKNLTFVLWKYKPEDERQRVLKMGGAIRSVDQAVSEFTQGLQ